NLESFIDVSFLGEISKNVDAYRLSAYMYKDKDSVDGRLTMGPIWDYNLAFGNADYYDGWNPEGWQMDVELGNDGFKIPFWWYRIWDDTTYLTAFNQRWQDLRESIFSEDYIMSLIDSATTLIDDAQIRNFQRWPVLDEYVWPNAYVGGSYAYEIEYLKNWINNRLEWMDSELLLLNVKEDIIASEISVKRPYPNPFNPKTAFVVNLTNKSSIRLDIYNILGKKVKSINKNVFPQGKHTITWNATNAIGGQVESGVYLYELLVNNRLETGKLLYIK
ncbi:MAG: CotH kinase family protein, partial [Candidatus Neomarinimicrobiota bacterium]|nr:CotH kinase family protein [Candidatus Neomarinimicrobiota bacterium]